MFTFIIVDKVLRLEMLIHEFLREDSPARLACDDDAAEVLDYLQEDDEEDPSILIPKFEAHPFVLTNIREICHC